MNAVILSSQEKTLRLNKILGQLGVSFMDSFSLVKFTEREEVPTACWAFNGSTKMEVILFNSHFFDSLNDTEVLLVLKHEILHKGFYNGINFNFTENRIIGNIALDVCINFILFMENKEEMKAMSRKIFRDCEYDSPIVLCHCSADRNRIRDEKLSGMYGSIWDGYSVPSPYYIYYNLLGKYAGEEIILLFPSSGEGIEIRIDGSTYVLRADPVTKREKSHVQRVFRKMMKALGKGDPGLNELMQQFTMEPEETRSSDKVKEFLGNISVKKLSKITDKIKNDLSDQLTRDVYPWNLSRIGMIYLITGIYSSIPYYHNKIRRCSDGRKKQISIYIDCSSSMMELLPKIAWVLRDLDEFPVTTFNCSTLYSFDTAIAEVEIDDIRKGEFRGGGGTDFDHVVNHFLNDELDNEAMVIFTDGESYLDLSTIMDFKISGKKLYAIYFGNGQIRSDLDEIASMTISIDPSQ